MHGLADIIVAAKREREVTHTSADMGTRQILMDPRCGSDKVGGIGIMLLHTRGNSQHIRVENDIKGIHTHLFGQYLIGSRSYLNTAFVGCSLTLFVETHHHHRSTKTFYVAGMTDEGLFALFQ